MFGKQLFLGALPQSDRGYSIFSVWRESVKLQGSGAGIKTVQRTIEKIKGFLKALFNLEQRWSGAQNVTTLSCEIHSWLIKVARRS